jgi:hypothetical protein
MSTRYPLITWGRFSIPEKRPFREERFAVLGGRVRRQPAPGAEFRESARDGSSGKGGGFLSHGRSRRHVVFSDRPLHDTIFFCRRGRGALPMDADCLPEDLIGSAGENFIVASGSPRRPLRGAHSATRPPGSFSKERLSPFLDSSRGNRRECFPARRWGSSSAGRAPRSQRGGRGFNPLLLHHLLFQTSLKLLGMEPASGADERPRCDLNRWRGASPVSSRGARQPCPLS